MDANSNMFHCVYSEDIIYSKRWYSLPQSWTHTLEKKAFQWKKVLAAQMQLRLLGGVAWQKDDLVSEEGEALHRSQKPDFFFLLSEFYSIFYLKDSWKRAESSWTLTF